MRVLWLATCREFYDYIASNTNISTDSEGGWYTGLHQAIQKYDTKHTIDLGIAFPCDKNVPEKVIIDNCTYYVLKPEKKSMAQRLQYLLKDYKKQQVSWRARITHIIEDFHPDLIHFFGIESQMAYYLVDLEVPYVVNLLGVLNPYYNTYFPINMNSYSVLIHNRSFKEVFFNSQIRFAYKSMGVRSKYEVDLFSHCKNVAGRTEWDRQITNIFAPMAKYYVINEILRPVFYFSQKWQHHKRSQVLIVSTISENTYKGFDLVLKAASLMKQLKIPFHWRVMGLAPNSNFTKFFERHYGIRAIDTGIDLIGRVKSKELVHNLLDADLFIHPSYIDNSPNSVCEAQYLGVPIIACNVGGVSSLIEHGQTGWLIPSNAPYEIAYYVKNYQKLPIESISINEIEVAEHRHNPQKVYQEALTCYESILKNCR